MRRGMQRDIWLFISFCTMLQNNAAGFNFQAFCAFGSVRGGKSKVCLTFQDQSQSDGQKFWLSD